MKLQPSEAAFKSKKKTEKFKRWRQAEIIRLHGKCPICDKFMYIPHSNRMDKSSHLATADHIISLQNGGTNDYSNLQLICQKCNIKKGTMES